MNKTKKILNFFKIEIWKKQNQQSRLKSFLYKLLRVFISSVQGFIKDKGFDKASTLTFYSLLAIIPLLAISFGIAQIFDFSEKFTEQVKAYFDSQPEVAEKLVQFSNSTLKNSRGGIIASFGIAVLFWTVITTISNMESFFNEIWHVETSRTLWQSIKSYTPFILLFPIFMVGTNSVIISLSTSALFTNHTMSFLSPIILYGFQFLSYLVSWSLLSFIYIYLPKANVSWRAGFFAGIITGIIFFIWQWIYVKFQAHASSYGVIYGSFAALPLFLIWLNYSWQILIFGEELCYHIQHDEASNFK